MSLWRNPVVLIFTLIGLVFGLVAVGLGWSCYRVLTGWPAVEATVQKSRVQKFGRGYGLALVLDYQVQGKAYRSSTGSSWSNVRPVGWKTT